ncbi:hypothetical protein N7492_009122 [Penicillium capsulatum]|uniref:FAD-binding domain-containing protein n=1 Tax=Penicillium capsulatum TaxID=69766 RepID=A0A9W9HWK5_9EURO|nr:hypothetical protein N7492_009122 [Penicillium capsulatum]
MTISPSYQPPHRLPTRCPASNISTLIVGAGVGGLMAGLECWRKGHSVRIIERSPVRLTSGDGVTIGHSAIRALDHWPDMAEENERIGYDFMYSWHKITGEKLTEKARFQLNAGKTQGPGIEPAEQPPKVYRHSRPKFHLMLCRQLEKLGLEIEYGKRVMEYFEDPELQKAGVVVEDGERIEADVVLAADGIGSKSARVTIAMADPVVRERFHVLPGGIPSAEIWIGAGVNAVFTVSQDEFSWVLIHPDAEDSSESWSQLVDPSKALETMATIPGWPEIADRVIGLTPKDKLYDFKLIWREPQPDWVSSGGLIVQIGDAAHPMLPTSGNGATQAMEDAISLAACLQVAGKENVQWATRVHNKLRFERVTCLQKLGIINHQSRHRSNNPSPSQARIIGLTAAWIWEHDPERYAVEKYSAALAYLREGSAFQNTNIPRGYVYRPWTIDGLLSAKEEGQVLEMDWEEGPVSNSRL